MVFCSKASFSTTNVKPCRQLLSASISNLTGSKGTRLSLDPNSELWQQQRWSMWFHTNKSNVPSLAFSQQKSFNNTLKNIKMKKYWPWRLQLHSFIAILLYRTHTSFNATNYLCSEDEQRLHSRKKDLPSSTAEVGRRVLTDTQSCTTSVGLWWWQLNMAL